jgi:uncharacterized protein (TIGR00299 family) protein
MTIAYFDCFSGISGDMTLGALLHLGVPLAWLREQLHLLPLSGFDIEAHSVMINGIQAQRVQVSAAPQQPHRHLAHIVETIRQSPLSAKVQSAALEVFDRIAAAEADIHGCEKDAVHFHEVGAVDAIVDIVGTCLALEYLGIDRIWVSPLPLGSGLVTCQHGVLPVPAPATLAILKDIPVYGGNQSFELVTPTGAALVAVLAENFGALPCMQVQKVGYGAGSHTLKGQPNLLRVVVGQPAEDVSGAGLFPAKAAETIWVVETAIDDMNPELYGYLMERLFEDGALDVLWVPVHMKKNRPATLVQVICVLERRNEIIQRILNETTSLGIRYHQVHRTALERSSVTIDTPFGPLAAKKVVGPDGRVRVVPEFEACKQAARTHGRPLREVYEAVLKNNGSSD